MSNEKVQELLNRIEQEKRYEVLNYFNLGTKLRYDGVGDLNDYPIIEKDSYGRERRFKYECDISEEDYKRLLSAYENISHTNTDNDDKAENTLNTVSKILLILSIIIFVITLIAVIRTKDWSYFVYGIGVLLASIVNWAFFSVFVNISRKLDKIK